MAVRLQFKGVYASYGSIDALKDVTIEFYSGTVTSIVGPNGSGKSTLLKCINRLLKLKKGAIMVNYEDLGKVKLKQLSKLMGYVPQKSSSSFPFTVFDIVLMGRRPYVSWRIGERDKAIVIEKLELLGITNLAERYLDELSGGEQQKVFVARALAQEPKMLLLDEPTSNLDIRHQLEVLNIVRSLAVNQGMAIIMALHDLNLACRYSDTIILLKEGRVFAVGNPESVLNRENIKLVYGVDTLLSNGNMGRPYIIPIEPT